MSKRRFEMHKLKNILKSSFVFMIAVALVPWSSASALATVLVDPYDSLSTTSPETITVTGAGLTPGATIDIQQVAQKRIATGVANEPIRRGGATVDANGNFQVSVTVTYDPRSDGAYTVITECNNNTVSGELCYLRVAYVGGEVITQQKLYFGMADPNYVPPQPPAQPLSKDDCRDDKWGVYTVLGFKNQGACVSYVAKQQ